MTTFNKTITNQINVFGPQATNMWGVFVWGVDNWAYSSFDLPVYVTKEIDNIQTLVDDWSTTLSQFMNLAETISVAVDMGSEEIIDQNGFIRLFGNQENAENRALTSYTNVADQATAYTSVSRSVTSYTTQ